MQTMTGFGYLIKNGKIIAKYALPAGNHPNTDSEITYIDVSSQSALDAIVLDKTNQQLELEEETRRLSESKISAIEKLKTLGLTETEIASLTNRTI